MGNHKELNKLQKEILDTDLEKPEREAVHKSWFDETTVDFWLHNRMYRTIEPVATHFKEDSWISIGDGRYGLDSVRLKSLFGVNVLPTDISGTCLEEGKKMGLYEDYSVENAESLSFADNSFDVVICKESYHHFPRPMLALYEMIRVARKAVILIEPNDSLEVIIGKGDYLKSFFSRLASRFSNKKAQVYRPELKYRKHTHEGGGNFVYSLSNREVDKVVHGLDLPGSAYFLFNSTYIKGVEFEEADEKSTMFQQVQNNIKELDEKGGSQLTTTVIFTSAFNGELKKAMEEFGYYFCEKVDNPVLKKEK